MTTVMHTTKPASRPEQQVLQYGFSGTREQILAQVSTFNFPASWGKHILVEAFIGEHIPSGPGWHGSIKVTGYRTTANDKGTGTVYLSLSWTPEHGK